MSRDFDGNEAFRSTYAVPGDVSGELPQPPRPPPRPARPRPGRDGA